MAQAVAGTIASVSAPVLGTVNIVQGVQQQVNSYFIETYKMILGSVRDLGKTSLDTVGKGAIASAITGRGILSALGKGFSSLYNVGKISLSTFHKIVEKAVGSPESVVVAVLMYRVVDSAVSVESSVVSTTIDNFISNFESFEVRLPTIPIPRISLSMLRTSVSNFFENVKSGIDNISVSLTNPVTDQTISSFSLGCRQPDAWESARTAGFAWIGYGFCVLGENVIKGLFKLLQLIIDVGITIVRGLLTVIKFIVDFIKYISDATITFIESLVNSIVAVIISILNSLIGTVEWIVNAVFTFAVKTPIVFITRYVIKPIAMALIDSFRYMRDMMKTVLCDYLRISPVALWFTSLVKNLHDASIGKAFISSIASMIFSTVFTGILVPECSLIPMQQQPLIPPQGQGIPPISSTTTEEHSANIILSVSGDDSIKVSGPRIITFGSLINVDTVGDGTRVLSTVFDGGSLINVSGSDDISIYVSKVYDGSSIISVYAPD